MLEKKQNAVTIICANIIILLVIYVGIIVIHFFTEEEIITKETMENAPCLLYATGN